MDHHPATKPGVLRNQRGVLNHLDVSTQANFRSIELCGREKRDTAHYNRQDIREQYCITDRGLGALEANRQHQHAPSLFGCVSLCSSRPSLLTACVRQKAPSDENLCERRAAEYAPYPRRSRSPWGPVLADSELQSSYFRRKAGTDPSRYTWMPPDDESVRLERPTFLLDGQEQLLDPSLHRKKHVSFARSHTMASFDDALSRSTSQLNAPTKSHERLLEVRKSEPITKQPGGEAPPGQPVVDKLRRTPMKTQATQTEASLGRRTPPSHISLSLRSMQKVETVSQGAQTNGRQLVKSYSEAGDMFLNGHEPLHRTQSDEPPRSPFLLGGGSPPQEASLSNSEDSAEVRNEIFIDFKPQVAEETTSKAGKKCLTKALSDGEILLGHRRALVEDDRRVPTKSSYSLSHENVQSEDAAESSFSPHFQKSPILDEGICSVYSSRDAQDSLEEDFHERFLEGASIGMENWLRDEGVVPSISLPAEKRGSPCTSTDSLANDARDQSDGIWNESQVTVLQLDSGAELTPSSRRKHLLMLQHQQRSSFDSEALLDEEVLEAVEAAPRQYLCVQKAVPPPPRRRSQQQEVSPQPAVVPDLLLARTDSCRTNTDVSESTTTDDYVTANSGTDSSLQVEGSKLRSDLHVRLIPDDVAVPPVPTGRSTPSEDTSSSCGSYSVGGAATPDLLEASPSRRIGSEDDRSVRYSSSGCYESPVEDDFSATWTSPKINHVAGRRSSPATEKAKRARSRMRSPMRKSQQLRKPSGVRLEGKATSDESSCEVGASCAGSSGSPKKTKKAREGDKRKSPGGGTGGRKPASFGSSPDRSCTVPVSFSNEDGCKLQAVSAESLRSVSPGSDSVFYSDHLQCLQCGKEVTAGDPDKSPEPCGEIFQPPAGFQDSPRAKHPERLYKKFDRRLRSEERNFLENKKNRHGTEARAKSEERGARSCGRSKLRPMARSTTASQEQLKAADSSPSVLPDQLENGEESRVYDVPYMDGCWIHIDEREEFNSCRESPQLNEIPKLKRSDSVSSTESERDFRKRYKTVSHRLIHRKSCMEMYKKHNNNAIGCDKIVVVHRDSGEFGFRIHGTKPVVVSAIEAGSPAESSGLEVGDIVLRLNGVSVLDKSHSEIVKMAHAGSDTLEIEVARTFYALQNHSTEICNPSKILFSGYLWKRSGFASGKLTDKWVRRWFCLRDDNCLYCYKTEMDKHPVDAVMLLNQVVHLLPPDDDVTKPNGFSLKRPDGFPLHLAADSGESRDSWLEMIDGALGDKGARERFLEASRVNLASAPSAIADPDCFGYLLKLGTHWKAWTRRYYVLKEACLYFYQDASASKAFGAVFLHGYKVQPVNKKHAFEIIPPDPTQKHFYFYTDSEADRKMWVIALEYSIDKWMKIH